MNSKIIQAAAIIILLLGLWYILFIGKSLWISLIFTAFIYILVTAAYNFFNSKIKNKAISIWACILSVFLFFLLLYIIISTQVEAFWEELPKYRTVFSSFTNTIQNQFWISIDIQSLSTKIDFKALFDSFSGMTTGFLWQVGTISFLLMFLFIEKWNFLTKIKKVFNPKDQKKLSSITEKIHSDLTLYFWVKFMMALLNAFVWLVIMSIFWVDYALFFALLIFLFDFIPNIGALIAISLPVLFSFTIFDSTLTSVLLLLALLIPQTITWNVIEPKLIWTRLNLSGFFILLALIFWWSLWWLVWAFLAVPLMTSINIILAKFEKTKKIAIMLSEKWDM